MSRLDKLVARFKSRPSDFTWNELVRLLNGLGYEQSPTGKTSGSRRSFRHPWARPVMVHKPHPGSVVKVYQCDEVRRSLTKDGLI